MNLEPITFIPIGQVRSDFGEPSDPKTMRNSVSALIIDKIYEEALEGLDKFDHILVVYHIDRAAGYDLMVHPMGDATLPKRGLFATRTPRRPNSLGVTVAKILTIEKNEITVTGLDALDKSPLLDIKPYLEHFDSPEGLETEKDPNYHPRDG